MKVCEKCANQVANDTEICPFCGAIFSEPYGETTLIGDNQDRVNNQNLEFNYLTNNINNQNVAPEYYQYQQAYGNSQFDNNIQVIHNNNILESYKLFWKNYIKFNGRTRRRDFWQSVLCNFVISAVLGILTNVPYVNYVAGPLLSFFTIAAVIPAISLGVRRLHDTGKSGLMFLLALIPIVGEILLIIWFVQESQAGSNAYGENPKGMYS